MPKSSAVSIVAAVLLACTSPAAAADYRLTDLGELSNSLCLGPFPTDQRYSFANALNDKGQAAGGSCVMVGFSFVLHGFSWTLGVMTDLGSLGAPGAQAHHSVARGMNDAGVIVGEDYIFFSQPTAFLRSGTTMTSLEPVLGLGGFSAAYDINNAGQVVGSRGVPPAIDSWTAFRYDSGGGGVTPLPGLGPTSFRVEARAINEAGAVAGYSSTAAAANVFHAVRWIGDVPLDLGTLGGTHSFGFGINASGEVVGHSWMPGDSSEQAFLYSGGTMAGLGTLGGGSSHAYGINDSGHVVGSAATGTAPLHAFLYRDGVMHDLNDLIPSSSGFLLEEAAAISPSGEIVGTGVIGGKRHGFLLTPGQSFFTVSPCRLIDTRGPDGPLGGPALAAGVDRTFVVAGQCGIPARARAISVNLAVTGPTSSGHLRLWPFGAPTPLVSSINYSTGQTRSNNAVVSLGVNGDLKVRCVQDAGTTHFILDVNGYFELTP